MSGYISGSHPRFVYIYIYEKRYVGKIPFLMLFIQMLSPAFVVQYTYLIGFGLVVIRFCRTHDFHSCLILLLQRSGQPCKVSGRCDVLQCLAASSTRGIRTKEHGSASRLLCTASTFVRPELRGCKPDSCQHQLQAHSELLGQVDSFR